MSIHRFSALLVPLFVMVSGGLAGAAEPLEINEGQRIAFVGNSTAERMNLYGNLETMMQLRFSEQRPVIRNFGWPADEVGLQQRPNGYTLIDDPMVVFGPDLFVCFFGFNESFGGADPASIAKFIADYRNYISRNTESFTLDGRKPRFVLVTPIAFESTGIRIQPSGQAENQRLSRYADAVRNLAAADGHRVVDLWTVTSGEFAKEPGAQFTINGVHLNEQGDELMAREMFRQLFGELPNFDPGRFDRLRAHVNDKSWFHLQDYRMLNGWYVYGGRRTWDTETFPTEYRKIRELVAVRDRYVWDLAAGRDVPDQPDDSATGEIFEPETMFGTRSEEFREMREPKTLVYPTPEESISKMQMPDDFEVQLFASEREFPELANPTQIAFDSAGRLWVSCMVNYPQWLPNSSKPNDRLLILEDTDGDGKADQCTTFYDKLICPTGFEFYDGGVLVVDEPRIVHLKDNDGDDVADEVIHLIDGLATDDTHHTMGAWEYSHGGLLQMQEGIQVSTTVETPWGPLRNLGPSGSYVWDMKAQRVRHFRTPSYGNPWCLVFDRWGNGIIGDGTNAQQHWASLLSGAPVQSRRSVQPIFDNQGMRPAVGSDFLYSRHFPDDVQGQFIYGVVINMHGMPRFTVVDEEGTAGFTGQRIDDLLSSTDMFFRPVDGKIGPDGALWFGDWCNALIGHMQYSQRDPNRDHEHGRIYRMVCKNKPLIEPATQDGKSVAELLEQLNAYETRTRYRARRELWDRDEAEVLAAAAQWLGDSQDPMQMCEVLWLQEAFHAVQPELVSRILDSDDFHARAAAIHVVGNQWEWIEDPNQFLEIGIADEHPRVRLETLRALSFQQTMESVAMAIRIHEKPTDKWIDYVLEHTLQALEPAWREALENPESLTSMSAEIKDAIRDYQYATGPGARIFKPLRTVLNPDIPDQHPEALAKLVAARGGSKENGEKVFERTCANCHLLGKLGKAFGPNLSGIDERMTKEQIIRSIVWPNDEISKGYETVSVVDLDGQTINGFVLNEDDQTLTLGIANGKSEVIEKENIEIRKPMKSSSMPEGLLATIAPSEFLDMIAFLASDWITTNPNRRLPLRKYGEFDEVSRQSKILLGRGFPDHYSQNVGSFLSGNQPVNSDFAFHSPDSENNTSTDVIIRLDQPAEIRHVDLENRRAEQFHGRADGLAMWVSDDRKEWKKVWESERPAANWSFDLPAGTKATYIKLALTKPGIFHLSQGVFYGTLLEP